MPATGGSLRCLLCVLALLLLGIAGSRVASADEYSSDPEAATVPPSGVSVATVRSDLECAVRCAAADGSCLAFAFVPGVGPRCLMSGLRNADFSALLPGPSATFRRTAEPSWFRDIRVQIGNRMFRIIQQRSKGNLSFARNWTDYENGFGDDTDFWLGLKNISYLTSSTPRVFRMEAVTWAGLFYVSEYSGFTVAGVSTFYNMTFSSYLTGSSNTTSDSLTYNKGTRFVTVDNNGGNSCPASSEGGGGWWYKSCTYANPSGIYRTAAVTNGEHNMHWYGADSTRALKSIRLMLQV